MKQEIIERTMKDCEMCHHPIIDQYYLTVGDFMTVHQNCLRCATCSRLIDDEQKKCFYRERKFYCATSDCSCYTGHHDFDTVSSASSTNNDDYYHISDLSSSSSSSSSSSISSSIRQQRQHQQQSFWSSCHKCLRPIEQNQYFIRLNQKLYHMECFRCSKCLCRIDPGSPYGLLDDILCENHYYETTRNDRKPQQQQQLITDKTSKNQSDLNNNISTINNHQSETTTTNKNNGTTNPISTSSVIRPLKIDSSNLQQQTTSRFQNETLSIAKTSTTSGSSSRKKKRVRTSFKHQQLRMMKAHFLLNQNPDSKELKELSEKTGLQKRVLQVWFQNSRAKQRKCSSALPSPSTSGSFIDCTRSNVGQHSLNGAVTPMTTMSHHMFSHPQRHHLLLQHPTIASSVGHSQQHQQHLPSSVGDEDEDDDDDQDDNSEGSDSDDDLATLDMDEQPSDSTATSEYYFDFV